MKQNESCATSTFRYYPGVFFNVGIHLSFAISFTLRHYGFVSTTLTFVIFIYNINITITCFDLLVTRIQVYTVLALYWLSPLFYTEEKFGPLEKRIKKTGLNPDEIFQKKTAGCNLFDDKRNEEILE